MFGKGYFQVRLDRAWVVVLQVEDQVDVPGIGVPGVGQYTAKRNRILVGLPQHILKHLVLGSP